MLATLLLYCRPFTVTALVATPPHGSVAAEKMHTVFRWPPIQQVSRSLLDCRLLEYVGFLMRGTGCFLSSRAAASLIQPDNTRGAKKEAGHEDPAIKAGIAMGGWPVPFSLTFDQ